MTSSNDYLQEWLTDTLTPNSEDDDDFENTLKSVVKKLNSHYWDTDSDNEHVIVAGSYGRKTHTKRTSDHDVLFVLPLTVKEQFDKRQNNKQSQLLTSVKEVISERYPKTVLRSDGQVVSIEMKKGTIELIPVFERLDQKFDFPNTNAGGSWEVTNPKDEINKALEVSNQFRCYREVARLTRSWRSFQGIKLKGIVIDTLLCEFLQANFLYSISYNLESIFIDFLNFMGEQSSTVYTMMGSGDLIDNDDPVFVDEAKRYSDELKKAENSEERNQLYSQMFGKKFPGYNAAENESFIEDRLQMGIKYTVALDADIKQNGYRTTTLRSLLSSKRKVVKNLQIIFKAQISDDAPNNVKYLWKVRNVGQHARSQSLERGEILSDEKNHIESSKFTGNHFVEIYVVSQQTVIARNYIKVPIDALNEFNK
ncbi:nucleotidyltransferase domain-containing protein [Leuconostoc lactis]|uniref:SMODS domain-containing nucleotidyltransferase n=1 Tax=Leuconostoc lactis TaxID=1246 RepID=UPI0028975D3E|nr:nucleotidyltransferase domain-containing protein [Leuconostoc lactis]